MRIDIGGGTIPEPGYVNLDPIHGEGEFKRRVQDGIPCADGSATHVRASHVMEHIPSGAERIFVMNEVHRVLKSGGEFEIIVPLVPTGSFGVTWHAFADPTHVSFWVLESFYYFDGTFAANATYDISLWKTSSLEARDGWEGHWIGVRP